MIEDAINLRDSAIRSDLVLLVHLTANFTGEKQNNKNSGFEVENSLYGYIMVVREPAVKGPVLTTL